MDQINDQRGESERSKANSNHISARSGENLHRAVLAPPPLQFKLQNYERHDIETSSEEKTSTQLKTANGEDSGSPQDSNSEVNKTGLPNQLKSGIENLSGFSLDDVKVHRNSDKPAQLQAHAYAQGTDIHLGPGQEKHLPHEAWHVVQQKQGRVKPTMQMKAFNINDDVGLEREADNLGGKAMELSSQSNSKLEHQDLNSSIIQAKYYNAKDNIVKTRPSENASIRDAKEAAKSEAAVNGDDAAEFTAHHKYPWNKIKEDIEDAFKLPKTDESQATLSKLEEFSDNSFPVTKPSFLNSLNHRETTYRKKENLIDTWIQNVCWVPGNIFIGPLSEKRVDDPSKRGGDDDFDGHYRRNRRMSLRSEQLYEIFNSGGIRNAKTSGAIEGSNSVAPFNESEWAKVEMGEGEVFGDDRYMQSEDPYYEQNIFPYNITSANTYNYDHNTDTYDIEIETPENVKKLGLKYSKRKFNPKGSEEMQLVLNSVLATGKKKWTASVPTPKGHAVESFRLIMIKDNSVKKEIELDNVLLTHR